MTELEYVVEHFDKHFKHFRKLSIVIHGTREYAKAIIDRFHGTYHFVGVMTMEPFDEAHFAGLDILNEKHFYDGRIDMVILTERVKYEEAAYQAIGDICRTKGIRLYDMYGLDVLETHRELAKCDLQTLESWKQICAPYDMVVFETMDTFLNKNYLNEKLYPRDSLCRLIHWLSDCHKEIRFSLRLSYPEEKQIQGLKASGVCEDVEKRVIRRKGEDLSFRKLREDYPEKSILYIGNGLINECILPRYYGIDTYRYIWDLYDCLMPQGDLNSDPIPYDSTQKEKLKDVISQCDLISFDVFDTLLIRKTLFPADVFALAERRGKERGLSVDGFAKSRREAEWSLVHPDIFEIYRQLAKIFPWPEETVREMLEIELEIEEEVIVPRSEVIDCFYFARQQGKKVVLTSDMYMTGTLLEKLLEKNGIQGYDLMMISCEYRKNKAQGLLSELSALCANKERILHIGDDLAADGKAAEACGIQSVVLPSPRRLAGERGWKSSIQEADSLSERCLTGMIISALFRDPFQNPNLKERSPQERMVRYGAGVVGPLAVGHMTWLMDNLRRKPADGVLFLARDGYLSHKIYKKIRERFALPASIYFYANRRTSFLSGADGCMTSQFIISKGYDYGFDAPKLLERFFDIPVCEQKKWIQGESYENYIRRHEEQIRRKAKSTRKGYMRYAENKRMLAGGHYAIVDFVASGTTQELLSYFMPFSFRGYYFGNHNLDPESNIEVEYYLHGENKVLLQNYVELESFFTSPEPSADHINEDGTVIFAEEKRSPEELHELSIVLDTAEKYAMEFFRLFYNRDEVIRAKLVEEMYAAEGFHWVQRSAFEDWAGVEIAVRPWKDDKEKGRRET